MYNTCQINSKIITKNKKYIFLIKLKKKNKKKLIPKVSVLSIQYNTGIEHLNIQDRSAYF